MSKGPGARWRWWPLSMLTGAAVTLACATAPLLVFGAVVEDHLSPPDPGCLWRTLVADRLVTGATAGLFGEIIYRCRAGRLDAAWAFLVGVPLGLVAFLGAAVSEMQGVVTLGAAAVATVVWWVRRMDL
jgi:hypothetical protein